jgi:SAM-dependent methyltransferase
VVVSVGLDDVRATWEFIGRDDPFWGVLSWEGTERGGWDLDRFFDEGERDIAAILDEARALNVQLETGDVLDFGCGVGRLSRALASRFERVTGIDISAPMIEQANRLVAIEHPNCSFIVNAKRRLPFPNDRFDLVVSLIVLQHLPPRLARSYVSEFMRVLRPGGVAIFQIPSEHLRKSQSSNSVIRAIMNALPSQLREDIFRRRGRRSARDLPMHAVPRTKMLRRA